MIDSYITYCEKCKAASLNDLQVIICDCKSMRDGETVSQHAVNVSVPGSNPGPAALGGLKYDQEKPPLDLIPTEAITQIAKVLAFGAKKYERHNWRKGISYSRLIAAALRHITAFNANESKDSESGISHIGHALCCLAFLAEFEKTRPELDDRYKGEK